MQTKTHPEMYAGIWLKWFHIFYMYDWIQKSIIQLFNVSWLMIFHCSFVLFYI